MKKKLEELSVGGVLCRAVVAATVWPMVLWYLTRGTATERALHGGAGLFVVDSISVGLVVFAIGSILRIILRRIRIKKNVSAFDWERHEQIMSWAVNASGLYFLFLCAVFFETDPSAPIRWGDLFRFTGNVFVTVWVVEYLALPFLVWAKGLTPLLTEKRQ